MSMMKRRMRSYMPIITHIIGVNSPQPTGALLITSFIIHFTTAPMREILHNNQ